MSTTVILKCDRCGESWDREKPGDGAGRRQLWRLSLFSHEVSSAWGPSGQPHFTVEWCRECIDRHRVLWPGEQKKQTDPVPPTRSEQLETLIREIVREEAADVVREAGR